MTRTETTVARISLEISQKKFSEAAHEINARADALYNAVCFDEQLATPGGAAAFAAKSMGRAVTVISTALFMASRPNQSRKVGSDSIAMLDAEISEAIHDLQQALNRLRDRSFERQE